MTFFRYGSYDHPASEVNLAKMSVAYRHSARGKRSERVDRLHLYGQFCEDSTSEVLTRIDELISTYQFDYQDCGLYIDADTPTPHRLFNDQSISGVRVLHRSWDGGPDELATTRTFDIILEATYPDSESQLLEWQESIETIGDGGPEFEMVKTFVKPVPQTTALTTAQQIIQSGSAVGHTAYVEFPGAILPVNVHRSRTNLWRGSATMRGRIATHYPCRWTYYMSTLIPQEPNPLTR